MSVSQYISYALIIVGVFTVYMAVVGLFRQDKNQLRTKKIDTARADIPSSKENAALSEFLEKTLVLFGVNVNKQNIISAKLARAGINGKDAVVYFLFFQYFIQPILFISGAWIFIKLFIIEHKGISGNIQTLLIAFLLTTIGGLGTKLFLDNRNEKRKAILVKTFPEALDLMLICVESGLGIDAALGRVCKEIKQSHPLISEEFERTRFEMTMMSDRVQALQNLAERTGVPAIRALVSSLIQAERFGTSLVDTMRTIAEEQRTERMLRAEAKAARLPALITVPLIFFIMPALFMVILGPVFVNVSEKGGIAGLMSGR